MIGEPSLLFEDPTSSLINEFCYLKIPELSWEFSTKYQKQNLPHLSYTKIL